MYGVGNALQDAWLEQVVERGATAHGISSLTKPGLAEALVLLGCAAAVEVAWFARERRAAGRAHPKLGGARVKGYVAR